LEANNKNRGDTLFGTLLSLRGNPRACVYTEPLWGIPYNLYIPFFTLYMFTLGLTDAQIGFIISMGIFLSMFSSLLGGVLTDKFGRRRTTLWGDIFSWTIPCFIWAFSQDFNWFIAGAFFNGMWQITNNSWQCLLVEDSDPNQLVTIYNWVYIAGLLSVFFAPISGVFIGRYSLVPVMRVLFAITGAMMTLKFIILYKYSTETEQGLIRLKESKGVSLLRLTWEYKDVLAQILKTPATVRVLVLISLLSIQQLISGNFFSLYVTQNLFIPDQYLAVFTIVRAAIMLVFFFIAQAKLSKMPMYAVMLGGLGLYIGGHVLLLNIPAESAVPLLVVFTAVDACAAALFLPRRDVLFMQSIDPKERPRIMSLCMVIMLGVTSPFGILAGVVSNMDRRLPFIANVVLFALMGCLIAYERKIKK
jgi:MFS family permease